MVLHEMIEDGFEVLLIESKARMKNERRVSFSSLSLSSQTPSENTSSEGKVVKRLMD